MARRSASPSREQLPRAELEALRKKLEAMPRHELETFYKATHNACRYALKLPSARLIQELVQAWRALRLGFHSIAFPLATSFFFPASGVLRFHVVYISMISFTNSCLLGDLGL